jgi:hypothetical protein
MTRDQFSRDDSPYDICETCGEQAWDWPRCLECGAVDLGYLHDKVKADIVRTLAKKDMAVLDWCENLSGLKRTGTWLVMAMPSARAWQSLGTAMSSHSAAVAVPSLSRGGE